MPRLPPVIRAILPRTLNSSSIFMIVPPGSVKKVPLLDTARLGDRAILSKLLDRFVVISGLAQHVVGVLSDGWRPSRLRLVLAFDGNRACDGEYGVIVERHQDIVGQDLAVIRDVQCGGHHVEYDSAGGKDLTPFRVTPRTENSVENLG